MARGGQRKGAGRPKGSGKFKEATKVIRVPESAVDHIHHYIDHDHYQLPFFSTRVAAGMPSPADDHVDNTLDLNTHLVHHPAETFLVEVTGESMLDAGIKPRDILVVDRSLPAADGKIAVVMLNGEFTVKTLQYTGQQLTALLPANAAFEPIKLTERDQLDICGMVRHVIHSF
jgi:DNA polymerase V